MDYEIHDLGDVRLQGGATVRGCQMAYKTFGTLNATKDNVVVYPTWYSAQHYENEWLIGPGMALDPAKLQYRSFRVQKLHITDRVFWDRQRWRVFLLAFRPAFV